MDENQVDERDIDDAIAMLGTGEYAFQKLERIGEPALHRLYQILDGAVQGPRTADWREGSTSKSVALGGLGRLYPETLLAVVQGKANLSLGVIWALGITGDRRLEAIGNEARRNLR
jgi:hypothetical protein